MAFVGMIPAAQPEYEERETSADRRLKVRYPLDLPVSYRTLGRSTLSGEGRALNISSAGMLVARSRELSVGSQVELRIEWPFLLEGRIGLQLVALGTVVRSGPAQFAVLFSQHQFRTVRSRQTEPAPTLSVGLSTD
jgi:hypothetical protein